MSNSPTNTKGGSDQIKMEYEDTTDDDVECKYEVPSCVGENEKDYSGAATTAVEVLSSNFTVSTSPTNTKGGSDQINKEYEDISDDDDVGSNYEVLSCVGENEEDHSKKTIPTEYLYLQDRALKQFISRTKPLIETTKNFIRYVHYVVVISWDSFFLICM